MFQDREIFVRLDPGVGRGHHAHVRTGGTQSKFGIARGEVPELIALCRAARVRVTGLHAHTGSGVFDVRNWMDTADYFCTLREQFPLVRVFDLGGGIGVPDRAGAADFDIAALDAALRQVRERAPGVELWHEPGRYVIAEAGAAKSLRRSGTSTARRTSARSARLPEKWRSSVSTEMQCAPPAS